MILPVCVVDEENNVQCVVGYKEDQQDLTILFDVMMSRGQRYIVPSLFEDTGNIQEYTKFSDLMVGDIVEYFNRHTNKSFLLMVVFITGKRMKTLRLFSDSGRQRGIEFTSGDFDSWAKINPARVVKKHP